MGLEAKKGHELLFAGSCHSINESSQVSDNKMGVFWKNIEKTGTECQGFLFGDSVPASFGFSQILLQENFKKKFNS